MEQTLIIVKPDGVQRSLIGEIIGRFEKRGLRVAAMKLMHISRATAEAHYAEHKGKGFFDGVVGYLSGSPTVVMVLEGPNAIATCRQLIGKTKPWEAEIGSIRGDLAMDTSRNLVHGSDGPESAAREIDLYFGKTEILGYVRATDGWLKE